MDMGIISRTLRCLLRCPSVKRLVSVTPLPPCARLELDRVVQAECTWAKTTSWHIYNVRPASMKQGPQAVWHVDMSSTRQVATRCRRRASSASALVKTLEKVDSL